MAKVSKELIEFKNLLEDDEIETYGNEEIEELNLDFLIDYIYDKAIFLDDFRHQRYTLHFLEEILLIIIFELLSNCNTYKEIELFIKIHYNWLIKKLKRIAFGFRSFTRFKARIMICKGLITPKQKEVENLVFSTS